MIDTAKAVAACMDVEGDVWEFFTTYAQPEAAIPIGVVLTLPGTGSESGGSCVITNEETKQKFLYGSLAVKPKFCIIDPELYLDIPPKVYWPGICDMFSHIMERYFSASGSSGLSDRLCETFMLTILSNARRLLKGESGLEVWSELALAGNFGHNGVCDLGREGDWACHGIEHELSGFYDVVHGAGMTVLLPAWMKYVYREDIPRFERFAEKIMGVESEGMRPEEPAREGIKRLEEFFKALGMPTNMSELGISDRSLYETMARRAVGFGTPMYAKLGGIKKLDVEDIVSILELAEQNAPTL